VTPEARRRRQIRTPVLVVTALAWAVTVLMPAVASSAGNDPNGMAGMPGMAPGSPAAGTAQPADAFSSLRAFLAGWPLMLTAMMAPLLIPALRHAYARSLSRRRWRTLTLLVLGYAATWSVAGLALRELTSRLHAAAGSGALAAGMLLAAAWQFSPVKQRCLNRHHAHPPLAAFGRAADQDAVRFGSVHALWCIGCCWSLMLLPLLAGRWQPLVMLAVTLWIWAESFDTPVRPTWRVRLPVKAARIVAGTGRSLTLARTDSHSVR
jgi:predicted metal-binding membrane protein